MLPAGINFGVKVRRNGDKHEKFCGKFIEMCDSGSIVNFLLFDGSSDDADA